MRASSRRSGDGRRSGRDNLSPPPHASSSRSRDHGQRSVWRHYSSRSRQSLSPASRDHHRRSRKRSASVVRRSASIERADYEEAAAALSRHGKQHHQQRDNMPLPHPSQSRGGRAALALESSLTGDDSYDGFQHKYLQTDSPTDVHADANPKMSRVVKVREFHHPPVVNGGTRLSSSGAVIDDQHVLVQKSVYLDDGSVRTFFPLPPEQAGYPAEAAAALNPSSIGGAAGSSSTMRIGVRGTEEVRYHERLKGTPYEDEEKQKVYSRDVPYSVIYPSQRRPFGGASSSSTARGEVFVSYQDDLCLPSEGFGRSNDLSSFRDEILRHDEYGRLHLFDTVKLRALSPPVRDETRSHGYAEFVRRERDDYRYPVSDEPHKKVRWASRGEYREILGSGFSDPPGRRVDVIESPVKIIRDSRLWEPQHGLEGGAMSDYHDMKRVHEEYLDGSGNVSVAYGTKPSHDGGFVRLGRTNHYGRDLDMISFRERSRSPQPAECRADVFRRNFSPPRRRIETEDLDIYDPPFERVAETNYITEEEINILRETRNARAIELNEEDERWAEEQRMEMSSRRSGFDCTKRKMLPHRISDSDAWPPSNDSFVHSEGGRVDNMKRRMKPGSCGPFSSDRRQDFYRPNRYWKKRYEDQRDLDRDIPEDERSFVKNDPLQDSEEFKQQVHKAFLRFTKLLNEDPHQQKRYRDPEKANCLLCCICGSQSKEFMDTHSLVSHAFHSQKNRLRAEHLGLHKALCVLMGWNWVLTPDNARSYQMSPVPEFKALKEDLIIWPPVVIIHDISIGDESMTDEPKAVTNEFLKGTLKEMGFEVGKVKVCGGKPSNQSITVVKFMPTFSGLQEADKLHKCLRDKKHGRKEFEEAISKDGSGKEEVEPQAEAEQLLYGYMGTMEDLDKLDPETKKRCVLKSKKEIESIADAPLRVE